MNFSYVVMPDYFTHLLKVNHHKEFANSLALETYFYQRPPLKAQFEIFFKEVDPKLRFGAVFKSLGWTGLRDRLCAGYVHKVIYNHFPNLPDQDIISDVIALENKLKPYTVEGHNRSFLYGFYLKLEKLSRGVSVSNSSGYQHLISPQVLSALDLAKAKVVHIDHVICLLEHFYSFFGETKLLELVKKSTPFSEMLNECTKEQKNQLILDILNYGGSINETDYISKSFID